jgi:ferredoxin
MYETNEFYAIRRLWHYFSERKIMADKNLRSPENVPGKYYVDSSCIDCGLCPDAAPSVFKRYDEGGYNIVHKQPATEQEAALAEEAREACPTESIGNDGECGKI